MIQIISKMENFKIKILKTNEALQEKTDQNSEINKAMIIDKLHIKLQNKDHKIK